MSAIDLGTTTTVTWELGENGKTVVLTVTKPDGTTSTPTVTETTGSYSAPVTTSLAGRYLLSWVKAASPAKTYTDILDVWPADPRFLCSISEVISAIRVSSERVVGGSLPAADQSDMRLFIAAVTPMIEDITGPILADTKVQKEHGGRSAIRLYNQKITAVTSVVVDGRTLGTSEYVVDERAGVLYAGTFPGSSFAPGLLNVEITYTVGSTIIPPQVRTAAATLAKRMWQQLMQAQHGFLNDGAPEETTTTPSGYVVPIAVYQMLKGLKLVGGVG